MNEKEHNSILLIVLFAIVGFAILITLLVTDAITKTDPGVPIELRKYDDEIAKDQKEKNNLKKLSEKY